MIRLYGNYNVTPQAGTNDVILTTYSKSPMQIQFLMTCCPDGKAEVIVENPRNQPTKVKAIEKSLYGFEAKLFGLANLYTIRIRCDKEVVAEQRIMIKVDESSLDREDIAVIFAVEKHDKEAKKAGWEDLKYTVEDAKALKWTLEEKFGFDVQLYVNPSWEKMYEVMEKLKKRPWGDLDQLFVYFTGHGHQANGRGYLIPSNAGNSIKTYYKMEDFRDQINSIGCNNIALGIDACFAASFLERGGTAVPFSRKSANLHALLSSDRPFRYFIGSSPSNQEVKEKGIFLRDENKAKGKYKYAKKKFKVSEFMFAMLKAIGAGDSEFKGGPIPIWYVGRKVEELYQPKKKISGQYIYARATRFGSQQDKGFHFLQGN
ncbi:MAG: caspase family protein [Bacteroidota bacterium]